MDEIESALREAELETPPEVALSAVRTFRYRALAVLASIVSLGVLGATFLPRYFPPTPQRELTTLYGERIVHHASEHAIVADVEIGVWEMAFRDDKLYFHVLARSESRASFSLTFKHFRFDGVLSPANPRTLEGHYSGREVGSSANLWLSIPTPPQITTTTFEVEVRDGPYTNSRLVGSGTFELATPYGG